MFATLTSVISDCQYVIGYSIVAPLFPKIFRIYCAKVNIGTVLCLIL